MKLQEISIQELESRFEMSATAEEPSIGGEDGNFGDFFPLFIR